MPTYVSVVTLLGKLAALTAFFLIVHEFLRRKSTPVAWAAWGCYLVLPLVFMPYWIATHVHADRGIFPWIKLYSVCFTACWLTSLRVTSFGRRRWGLVGILVLSYINIVEAIVQDGAAPGLFHHINAASGVLLLIALSQRARCATVESRGGLSDLHFYVPTGRSWIVGYTLWNWVFVYLNFPDLAGHQLAALAAALAVGMIDPARWAQARVYTLAVSLILIFISPSLFVGGLDTSAWSSPAGQACAMMVSFAYMVLLVAWRAAKVAWSVEPRRFPATYPMSIAEREISYD